MTKAEFIQRAAISMVGNASITRYSISCGLIITEAERLADEIEKHAEFDPATIVDDNNK